MEKAHIINENADDYIKWFRRVFATIFKWDIKFADIWNMDESEAGIGISHKLYVIVTVSEKNVKHSCWDLKCESLSSTLDMLECKMQTNDDYYSILTSGWASLIGLVPLWLNLLVSVSRSFQNG
jgi:hypothetical protein